MKHLKRKLTAAILSVLLATSSFTAAPISVTAATIEETEAGEDIGANETDGANDEVSAAENDSVGEAPTSGTTGDCTWEIDEEGTLTISGNGGMKESYYSSTEWEYWRKSDIKKLIICNGVTSIGYCAFNDMNLTSVTIPDSVTSIGSCAFANCTNLTSITIPDSVTSISSNAFANCTNLTSITIPGSVADIESRAFSGCTGLTNVTILEGVTRIGENAFEQCNALTSINIPDSVTDAEVAFDDTAWYNNQPDGMIYVGKAAYKYKGTMPPNTSIVLRNGTKSITNYAFANSNNLTSIAIPDSVTSIGWSAFSDCTGLTSVNIPNSVTAIGWATFSNCQNLTSIAIPDNVTTIGDLAFSGCTSLTSINIPDNVSIGRYALEGCTGLTNITIPDNVTCIGNNAFDNTAWYFNQPDGVVYAGKVAYKYKGTMPPNTSIVLRNGTKSIANYAFANSNNLTSVAIPDSVTTIGDLAFNDCTSLTRVTIPESVTTIGMFAFAFTSLSNVKIPNSVNSIGQFAFFGCNSLTSVTIPGKDYNDENIFRFGCENLKNITYSSNIEKNAVKIFDSCTDMHIKFTDNVTTIGDRAFYGNTGITKVEIPKTVESIGEGAFQECINLEDVTIGSQTGIDDYYTTVGENAFKDCISIDSLYMGENVRMIRDFAFSGCVKQKYFVIPNNTKVIQNSVFSGCTSLERVRIGNGLSQLGDGVFEGCYNLSDIDVQEGNKYFYTVNGSLYGTAGVWGSDIEYDENEVVTKVYDKSDLIWYNRTSEDEIVTIPENVYRIRSYAFQYADNIKTINANKDLKTIEECAFCYNEFKLHLYDSLNSISSVYVDDIYYQGTKEQWEEIDGTKYIDYDYVTMHFLDSEDVYGHLYDDCNVIEGIETEFKESWFEDNSYYNHDLARLCSEMVVAGYHAEDHPYDLYKPLEELGFTLDEINMDTGRDEQNYFFASRKIRRAGKDYNLVFCGCIGSYKKQWNSDFDPWGWHSSTHYADKKTLKDVNHLGFNDAKDFVYNKLSAYLKGRKYNKDNTVLLLTGHSRGAAAANLLAAKLIDDDNFVSPDSIYTYTFATPNCTCSKNRFEKKYSKIYNIVLPTDFVTKVLPAQWEYGRYGETYSLPTKTNDANYSSFVYTFHMPLSDYEEQNYYNSGKMLDCLEKLTGSKAFADYYDGEETVWKIIDELTSHVYSIYCYYNQKTWVLGNEISPYDFFITVLCPFVNGADKDQGLALQLAAITEGTYYWNIVWFFVVNQKLNPKFEDAHKSETYCAFMLALDSNEVTTPRKGYNGSVNCPVDIEITEKDSGEVVGRIVNNTVDEEIAAKPNSVVMTVDGDEKEFWLPGNGEYDVRLIGNDNGVMDYNLKEIDPDTGEISRVNYYDVPVEKDKAYTDFFTSEKAFVITAENGSELTPDEAFNSENEVTYSVTVTAEGSGTASDSLTVPSGDYVTLVASPVKSEFLGWYQNDTLVSTDLEYRFRPTEDISLTAKFTGEDLKPVEFGDVDVDGEVTISDATQIQMYLAELVELEDVQVLLSDYNLDGSVDISDATQIQLKLAELI